MITVTLKIYENGQAGLQVQVAARGEARSKREQIYSEMLQEALKAGLAEAGEFVAAHGLGAPLPAEFLQALGRAGMSEKEQLEAAQPLGPDAVELKLPAPASPPPLSTEQIVQGYQAPEGAPPCFRPRPAIFQEFIHEVALDYRRTAEIHKTQGPAGEDRALLLDAAVEVLVEKANAYIARQQNFIAWLKTQKAAGGGA